jgi:hypothetical protein
MEELLKQSDEINDNVYNFKCIQILCGYFGLIINVKYSHVLFNMICFLITYLQINKELNIGGISQSVMNRLRKRHHFIVDVGKKGSIFANCIVCEYFKDSISKLGKNSSDVKEYELKLKKYLLHQKYCKSLYILGGLSLCVWNMNSYVLFMTKWIMQKLHFEGYRWRTK